VALRLAVERPALVRSLTLIEPVFFAVALADHPDLRARFDAVMAPVTRAMAGGDHAAAARAFMAVWGDGTGWQDLPDAQKRALAEQMPLIAAGEAALHHDAGGMLAPGRLGRLDRPAQLIEGSGSDPIIAAINEGLAARLPRVGRAVIMGAGHMAPITHPRQVGAEILRFLHTV
jgi:pimeloyl-ACP methyl ester carboxylesterase